MRRITESTLRARAISLVIACAAAIGVVQFYVPPRNLFVQPFAAGEVGPLLPAFLPSPSVFGRSGGVSLSVALPGDTVRYPIQVSGDPSALTYAWVRLGEAATAGVVRPLAGATLVAPPTPGFYQLAVGRGAARQIVDEVTVAVMVPFERKEQGRINGFRIGTYLAERVGRATGRPAGFLEVGPEDMALHVTKHFRVADFLPQDGQTTWPRYLALQPRLLDKLELVMDELDRMDGAPGRSAAVVRVNAGFRSPAYNRTVTGSANDSRHTHGDAADLRIDADGNGRVERRDVQLVMQAVDRVERDYPELVGGLGIYTSGRYKDPFVHIDARGRRARWNG